MMGRTVCYIISIDLYIYRLNQLISEFIHSAYNLLGFGFDGSFELNQPFGQLAERFVEFSIFLMIFAQLHA